MADILTRFNSGKIWDFKGGIHPPEMKSQSNRTPIRHAQLVSDFYVPVKQHSGKAGRLLVKEGDLVLKGQALTLGEDLRMLPVHAPTSGVIKSIAPFVAAHPSGLPELSVHIQADGLDQWREQQPIDDFLTYSPEQLIQKIYQAGVAGLGGAVFPTAAKIHSAGKQVKLLIINGTECEPYISCDDRLMRDYASEIIEGCRILRYILRPEKTVIAIEDNKPEAISSMQNALRGANDIEIRIVPTKYPSGASKQLIYLLTGMEVPSGQRSSSIGVLMHNVGTAFAVKRAVINDEPLIERVVTLTGDKIPNKGNFWVRIGTPINALLKQVNYRYDERFPVFIGGPMMGFIIPDLKAPITKVNNCLLAPDHFEYAPPEPEQSCIRCSSCSDACPVNLMPQQLYWFARSEDHQKSQDYSLQECIECGVCAYVCPSHIPLIQYFREEKAKIWEIKQKAQKADEAKTRFEARQARLELEEQQRKARAQRAAETRRAELAKQQGEDPVAAALARLKAKQQTAITPTVKTQTSAQGEILPDNSELMQLRKNRRLARQQAETEIKTDIVETDPKKAAVAAAIARAKAKKQAQTQNISAQQTKTFPIDGASIDDQLETSDPKKAAVRAAIARAKAKKQAQAQNISEPQQTKTFPTDRATADNQLETSDPKKAAVRAAIARAKAKKQAQAQNISEPQQTKTFPTDGASVDNQLETSDPKKAAVRAAIARAKAKKQAQAQNISEPQQTKTFPTDGASADNQLEITDPKKAAVRAAIARAKAKKQARMQQNKEDNHV